MKKPKEPFKVSFSKIKTWRRCQQQYHYKYVLKLRRKTKSLPLYKGSVVHSCLEGKYKTGSHKKALKVFEKEYDKLMDEEKAVYGNLPAEVRRLLYGYEKVYPKDGDNWVVVKDKDGNPIVEREFEVLIPGTSIVIIGVIDLVIEDEYGIWIVDHKTVKNEPPSNEARMSDVQTTLYFWVLTLLCGQWGIPKKALRGAIFNYLRTEPPKDPELLKDGKMSKRNIDTTWFFYKKALIKAGLNPDDYLDMKKKLKGREVKYYHRHRMDKPKKLMSILLKEAAVSAFQMEQWGEKGYVSRSLDKSCDWMCDYKDICYAELQGFDTDHIIKALYEVRTEDDKKEKELQRKGLVEREEI